MVSDDIAGIDEGKDIFLESLASTVHGDGVSDLELDVSKHVRSRLAETGESSKGDAGFLDVKAVLDISGEAAAAADCPKTMNTGSIRIDPKPMWEALKQTGTIRFSHSSFFGTKDL